MSTLRSCIFTIHNKKSKVNKHKITFIHLLQINPKYQCHHIILNVWKSILFLKPITNNKIKFPIALKSIGKIIQGKAMLHDGMSAFIPMMYSHSDPFQCRLLEGKRTLATNIRFL